MEPGTGAGAVVRGKLELPQLWESAKYISWPHTHAHPVVRVPRPSGTPESKTIRPLRGEGEFDTFERCEAYRNQRGVALWGERRWAELLTALGGAIYVPFEVRSLITEPTWHSALLLIVNVVIVVTMIQALRQRRRMTSMAPA